MGRRHRIIFFFLAASLAWCCSREPVPAEPAPEILQLPFSVSVGQAPAQTKMTDAIVQDNTGFRGISRPYFFPFNTEGRGQVQGTDAPWGFILTLDSITNEFADNADNGVFQGLVNGSNAHLFDWAPIQVQTDAALFYGKATDDAVAVVNYDSLAFKKRNGVLRITPYLDVHAASDIRFSLEPYLNSWKQEAAYNAWRQRFIDYLNWCIEVNVENKGVSPSVKYQLKNPDGYNHHPALEAAFEAFINYGKVSVGSDEEMNGRITELYRALYPYSLEKSKSADYHSGTYYYVYELCKAIVAGMTNKDLITTSGSGDSASLTLKNKGPVTFGLPAGAYALQYREGTKKFDIILDNKDTGTGSRVGIFTTDERYFTYPPSLWYGVNSPIKCTTDNTAGTSYARTTGTWTDILSVYTQNGVKSDSRAGAIVNPLQYGVARLVVQLQKLTSATLKSFNNGSVPVNHYHFPLTGVLVSGQKKVDFGFHPISTEPEYIVYDPDYYNGNSVRAYLSSNGTPGAISTLVLESEEGKNVNIALEFLNKADSGITFYGFNGEAIRPGMHFYLTGTLDYSSTNQTLPSVFVQDHVTTATLTVSSLENAHSVLPDLREVQLSIGVDVRMNWDQTKPVSIEIL